MCEWLQMHQLGRACEAAIRTAFLVRQHRAAMCVNAMCVHMQLASTVLSPIALAVCIRSDGTFRLTNYNNRSSSLLQNELRLV